MSRPTQQEFEKRYIEYLHICNTNNVIPINKAIKLRDKLKV